MRTFLAVTALLLLPSLVFGADTPANKDRLDTAIDKALRALQRTQEADGAWIAGRQKHPAITALCVMAYLSAGHVPGEGRYSDTLKKGIDYILSVQQPNGLISVAHNNELMYQHGICTLMLAEVAGMTDSAQGKRVRSALEKAVELILTAQRTADNVHNGGWRYQVGTTDSDLSVTGWQVMALRAAKNLGCDVPAERIEMAVKYVKRCQDPATNGFRYSPVDARVTVPCTGTGILALEICGKELHKSPEVEKAVAFLIKEQNLPRWGSQAFFWYGIYYCSQAAFQVGGNQWAAFRPALHKTLLDNQSHTGTWITPASRESEYGPNYSTAMAVLALTVEYRYLPIYQRGEEPMN